MTMLQSVVRRRRAVAAAGAVSAGLLVLSACDKPTPVSTISIGRGSVSSEAACYNDGKALDAKTLTKCATDKSDVKSIDLGQDQAIRIGVDPEIAENGWTILVNGRQFADFSKNTYRSVPGSVFFNEQYQTGGETNTISIQEGEKAPKGVWTFKLKKAY
ncbi:MULTISPECIES: DUF2771 domain-containing protein [Streptomyces]|uniref:DUF2771 domain-containing protein n=2 Tax=Streptomyces TaxID=1883 RepID=A0A2U9P3W1_STRAS|nr:MULTISPECIES: DUF2771 domain-containing protein [Streptomyces]AWT43934.1 DUF2771 domain-containing protein [Streptomyces actuosus]MBM4820927.1 DUF2771 domain-containing protein [Streptomyces actuosus]GHF79570.1 lipoprotein [Streptomyces griseosporeus]